jgi:hypothetical protein
MFSKRFVANGDLNLGKQSQGEYGLRTLQLTRSLPQDRAEIVPRRDAKLPHEIPCSALQIAIVTILVGHIVLLGSSKVRVARNGRGTLEALKATLGL